MDQAELEKAAAEDAAAAKNALEIIRATPVTTPALFTQAGEELKEIKAEAKRVTENRNRMRAEFIAPLQQVIAKLEKPFADALAFLAEAEKIRKDGITGYLAAKAESDRKALEATRAAVLEGNQEAATAALATVMPEAPKVTGISTVETWDFEVVDESQIPREFLQPNEKAIRAFVKAAKKPDAIPGVRAFTKTTVRAGAK